MNNIKSIVIIGIIGLIFGIMIGILQVDNKNKDIFKVEKTEYTNVYELKDKSWFILDKKENKYIFQAVELGDYDYKLNNETELKKIIAEYIINKYNVNENVAIQNVNNIFENIK